MVILLVKSRCTAWCYNLFPRIFGMDAVASSGVLRYFQDLPDPRRTYLVKHPLSSILVIAILAMICGAEDWRPVAEWGQCKTKWLETFLDLPNGNPSHDMHAWVARPAARRPFGGGEQSALAIGCFFQRGPPADAQGLCGGKPFPA